MQHLACGRSPNVRTWGDDRLRFVVAVARYTSAIPLEQETGSETLPGGSNLSAASAAGGAVPVDPREGVHRTDMSSSPRKTTIRSSPPNHGIQASVAKSASSAWYSADEQTLASEVVERHRDGSGPHGRSKSPSTTSGSPSPR